PSACAHPDSRQDCRLHTAFSASKISPRSNKRGYESGDAQSLLVSELRGRRAVRIRTHAQPAGVDGCGEFLGRRIAGLHFEHLVRDPQAGAVEIEFAPEFHRGLRIVVGL
ncbi:MAG: hypothetical protein WCK17_06525, partial [Verrucomicrobiota bacterium]